MSTITQQSMQSPSVSRHRLPERTALQPTPEGVAAKDATALTPAVSGDNSLPDGASAKEAVSLDPSSLKDRIDDLLAQQVQSGTLTSTQADTLKDVFGTFGDDIGIGGDRRPRSQPSGPPPETARGTSGTTGSGATISSASSTEDLLASFVKQLQSGQARPGIYGADGTRASDQAASSLLLNFRA